MIIQIQESLQVSLEESIDICLPYAIECRKEQVDGINERISDLREALEYIESVTEEQVNDFMKLSFIEGEIILNAVLRMKRTWN